MGKEFKLDEKRNELISYYGERINNSFKNNKYRRICAELIGQVLRDIGVQDKEFIKRLKPHLTEYQKQMLDKLAGPKLITK